MYLLIDGAASKIKIITNLDLCLIPVPKFPTPKEYVNMYDSNIIKIILVTGLFQIILIFFKIKNTSIK